MNRSPEKSIQFDPKLPTFYVGAQGSGMYPLMQFQKKKYGTEVSGVDLSSTNENVLKSHKKENIHNFKQVCISSAIPKKNLEYQEAKKLNIPVFHRAEVLAKFSENCESIAISGTHGKTTTTAMIAFILKDLEYAVDAIVGAKVVDFENEGYWVSPAASDSKYFVFEADESDRSFLKYSPVMSIINNIEEDHLDTYGGIESIKQAFLQFSNLTPEDGVIVLNWDDPNIRSLKTSFTRPMKTFGSKIGCDTRVLTMEPIPTGMRVSAVVTKDLVKYDLPMIGIHNVMNSICALTAVTSLGIRATDAAKSLAKFTGVKRRIEFIGELHNIKIYNDYAHNPGKISGTLDAFQEHFKSRNERIVAVFQPHRFTRTSKQKSSFETSLAKADHVMVCPTFSAGEDEMLKDYSEKGIVDSIRNLGTSAENVDSLDHLKEKIRSFIEEPSKKQILVFLGAGDISVWCEQIMAQLKK